MGRELAVRRWWQERWRAWCAAVLLPAGVVLVLSAPMLFTTRVFGGDWGWHLWLTWIQSRSIGHSGHPTYFAHGLGLFYPHFAFYGGTLYALGGYVSQAFGGHPIAAYVALYVAAMGAAYGGWSWLSHQVGLRGWRMHVPGLVFVTSAYYLAILYARGVFGEFVAVSMIPPVAASTLWLLRTRTWRRGPLAAFVLSWAILTGSHNITALWGTVFLAAIAALMAGALRLQGHRFDMPRLLIVGLALAVAIGINLWYLVPDVLYGGKTYLAKIKLLADTVSFFGTPGVIFHPGRFTPAQSHTPELYVQVPVFALIWALAALGLAARRGVDLFWRQLSRRLLLVLAVLLVLVLFDGAWDAVPPVMQYIQFPYRLHSYVALVVAGLVMIGLLWVDVLAPRARRVALASVVVAVTYGLGLATYQVWHTTGRPGDRADVLATPDKSPYNTRAGPDFNDASAPITRYIPGRGLVLPPPDGDRVRMRVMPPTGADPIETNIVGGDYLVELHGLQRLGRTAPGDVVVRRPADNLSGPVTVRISTRLSPQIVAGIVGSLLSLLLAGWLIVRPADLSRVERRVRRG